MSPGNVQAMLIEHMQVLFCTFDVVSMYGQPATLFTIAWAYVSSSMLACQSSIPYQHCVPRGFLIITQPLWLQSGINALRMELPVQRLLCH
jgi:hypothetical protein